MMAGGAQLLRCRQPSLRPIPYLCDCPTSGVIVVPTVPECPVLPRPLAQLNRDACVVDAAESTVRLENHRGESDLAELDLGEPDARAE